MVDILIYILIGIGLSIDAFSLAISYGTIINKKKITMSFIVGLCHFIMPIIGSLIGNLLSEITIDTKYITIFIFTILVISMIRTSDENNDIKEINTFNMFLLGIGVSIDSLSVGTAISLSSGRVMYAALIFSTISTITTFIGIKIGNQITQKYNNKAKVIGVLIFILVIIRYLFIG